MNKARFPLPPPSPVPPDPESPVPPDPVGGGGSGGGSGGGGGAEAVHGTGMTKNSRQSRVSGSSPPPHAAKEAKMGSSSA